MLAEQREQLFTGKEDPAPISDYRVGDTVIITGVISAEGKDDFYLVELPGRPALVSIPGSSLSLHRRAVLRIGSVVTIRNGTGIEVRVEIIAIADGLYGVCKRGYASIEDIYGWLPVSKVGDPDHRTILFAASP